MRYIAILTVIVLASALLWPVVLGAGQKLRERYSEIWNGGHDPEKVSELRDQDG